jgi:hypothetical protein
MEKDEEESVDTAMTGHDWQFLGIIMVKPKSLRMDPFAARGEEKNPH